MVEKVGFPVRNTIHQTQASFTLLLMRNLVDISLSYLCNNTNYYLTFSFKRCGKVLVVGRYRWLPDPVETVPAGSRMDQPLSKAE